MNSKGRSLDAVDLDVRWVRAGGFLTRYIEAGSKDAAPLLLVHDGAWGGCSSVSWARMIPLLARKYHVLAPDMLGFGGTDKVVFLDRSTYEFRLSHLSEFLRVLDVTEPILIAGSSFGGSTTLRSLCPGSPLNVRAAVSISGTGGMWRTDQFRELGPWDGSEIDLRRIVNLLMDDFPEIDQHINERLYWARRVGHFRAMRAPTLELPDELKLQFNDPWPIQLASCEVPVLLVEGSRDLLLERSWTKNLAEVLRNAQIVSIDSRHSPNIELPDLTFKILDDFFDKA